VSNPIFDEVSGRRLFVPDAPPDATQALPVISPSGEGMTYSRFVPASAGADALFETERHVRAHLSAVATTDDDPDTHADQVTVVFHPQPDGTLLVGHLNATPTAPYLAPGHDPFAGVDPVLLREVLGDGPH
jgi:hypothetical protein